MEYLDPRELRSLDAIAFRKQKPFPWINPCGLVTEDGITALRANLPEFRLFKNSFDKKRRYGQKSHDRHSLKFSDDLAPLIPPQWRQFLDELRGEEYAEFLRRTLGVNNFKLSFFWFFTPRGCSVSPHCDHVNKIGAHLFYLNGDEDWEPGWGGETEVLIPKAKIKRSSAPEFGDFATAIPSATSGTHSFFIKRTRNSWHGVREITCPPGYMRKIFMVSIQHTNVVSKYYHLLAA